MPSPASGQHLIVRNIAVSDADRVAELSAQLGYPAAVPAIRERIRKIIQLGGHAIFIGSLDGRIVAWIHVLAVHHLQAEPRAEIGGLVVTADARGAGIGTRMVARAEQWARDRGLTAMVVRSRMDREAAHRFYLREGYSQTKTSAVFTKEL